MYKDNKVDKYQICPYNSSHRILQSRFQLHLNRCRTEYPKTEVAVCPFSTTHHIPKPELNWHVSVCDSRYNFENFRHTAEPIRSAESMTMPVLESEDCWDNDDTPSYNPQQYVQNASVLRILKGAPQSKKKEFRQKERLRFLDLQKEGKH